MCDKEKLINEVSKRVPLWDKKHRNHQNRYITEKLWKEIGSALNVTAKEASKAWKNLRQEFRKQFFKYNSDNSGDAEESNWPFFQKMLFLRDQFTPTNSEGNLQNALEENAVEKREISFEENTIFSDQQDSQQSLLEEKMSSIAQLGGCKKRVRAKIVIGKALVRIEKEKLELKKQLLYSRVDEDVGFFNSLMPHVKKLSPRKKLIFRMKVQEMLYELTFRELLDEEATKDQQSLAA